VVISSNELNQAKERRVVGDKEKKRAACQTKETPLERRQKTFVATRKGEKK